jgi:hypothetical protein
MLDRRLQGKGSKEPGLAQIAAASVRFGDLVEIVRVWFHRPASPPAPGAAPRWPVRGLASREHGAATAECAVRAHQQPAQRDRFDATDSDYRDE